MKNDNLTIEKKDHSINLDYLGIHLDGKIHRNLSMERLVEEGLLNRETHIAMNGASMVDTGVYTGRSPKDKYFVEEDTSKDNIWWGEVNQKIDVSIFNELFQSVRDYYNSEESKTYIFDGFGGADKVNRLPIRIIAKKAWQAHFSNNMFVRPTKEELSIFSPEFTIINASDISNDRFALASGIATTSKDNAYKLYSSICVGQFSWNGKPGYRTENAPFGGFKDSGNGEKEGVVLMTKAMRRIRTFYEHSI